MLERREWVRANCDHLRTALMLEPRGHADMYGALLTEPERSDSDAGVLFMHNEGYSTMCGHGIIAVVTMAHRAWTDRPARRQRRGCPRCAGRADPGACRDPPRWGPDAGRAGQLRQRAVVHPLCLGAGAPGRSRDPRRRCVWRRLLRDRGRRISRHGCPAGTPERVAARRHGDQARRRSRGAGGSSARARAARHLRDHLHGAAVERGRAPAQRHDLRRGGGRSFAVRYGHVRGDGRARGHGPARRRTRRSCTRASSARGFAAGWRARPRSASTRRSCQKSRAKPTSPVRACS